MTLSKVDRQALQCSGVGGGSVCLACAPNQTEPLAVTLREAVRISGLSRSRLYILAGQGRLVFLKNESRVLVDYPSLKAVVAELPRAVIAAA